MMKNTDKETKKILIGFQKNEITEHFVYKRLSKSAKGGNKKILEKIAKDEMRHYSIWKKYTQEDVSPSKLKILKHVLLLRLFGLTFTIKLMEHGEENAQKNYKKIIKKLPETKNILNEENKHEDELTRMIYEEKLDYIGSMILGLNDALVELTGALAGLTFAFQNTRLIGLAGLITGIAASLSMMSSEYLSKKSEGGKNPAKASFYTGIAYIITVMLLVFPYFILESYYTSLAATLTIAILIILIFTYFISVTKEVSFKRRSLEMAIISLGIAAISFIIGFALRLFLNIGT